MRILFIGIFDNNEPQMGLRRALKNHSSDYKEIAWNQHKNNELQNIIIDSVGFEPELVFMQLQTANVINDYTLGALKRTGAFLVQWTGDVRQPLPQHYIDFGRKIDLSLFTNANDIRVMRNNGVNADYLQISVDEKIYRPIPPTKGPEIVFMGNHYKGMFSLSDFRYDMCKGLKARYGDRFGVYGSGYGFETKNLMFKQEEENLVYNSCKIAINCSHLDLERYTSDRFFRILFSGAFCLSKEFPKMDEYGKNNFATFRDFKDLTKQIDYYLENDAERNEIARNGHKHAIHNWTWNHRIKELLTLVEKYK